MEVCFFLLIMVCVFSGLQAYSIPNVKFEVIETGFRVSIPDVSGIRYVAFNINRNKAFNGFEPGEISEHVRSATDKRWLYKSNRAIQDGDIIYIWVSVQHEQLLFRNMEEPITVHKGESATNNESMDTNIKNEPPLDVDGKKCESSITILKDRKICKGELIFEDTFNGDLKKKLWKHEVYLAMDKGDSEFVLYEEMAETHNGELKIVPILWNEYKPGEGILNGTLELGGRCTSFQNRAIDCRRSPQGLSSNMLPPIVSGRISTRDSFSFKYGRVEIRAKVPKGDWLFPLLLLEPLTNNYGQEDYNSGQIRVAFTRGNQNLFTDSGISIDGRTLYGGAVLSRDANLRDTSMITTRRNEHFGDEYHIYTMIWTDRSLIYKVDGKDYGEIQGGFANSYTSKSNLYDNWKTGDYMAPLDQEFFITLGVSAGGHGDFPDFSVSSGNMRKPWDNTSPKAAFKFWRKRNNWKPTWSSPGLHVDYVEVYAV